MPLTPGTRLGPHEIIEPLGAGGMGEVYRARDTRLDRTVAVKVLPGHLSGNEELRQRFDREARAISQLSHPHVCALYDVGHQDGVDYLVMEYLEGETLEETAPGVTSRSLASPKSRSFTPDFVSITLPGLRSRWTIPRRWALSSASAIWIP